MLYFHAAFCFACLSGEYGYKDQHQQPYVAQAVYPDAPSAPSGPRIQQGYPIQGAPQVREASDIASVFVYAPFINNSPVVQVVPISKGREKKDMIYFIVKFQGSSQCSIHTVIMTV